MKLKHPQIMSKKALYLGAFCLRVILPCSAQQPKAESPQKVDMSQVNAPDAATKQLTAIPMRFMPAHLAAYYLDPRHIQCPPELAQADADGKSSGELFSRESDTTRVSLPLGVAWVRAEDGLKQLWVYGTPEGISKVRTRLAALDVKPSQFVFETRILRVYANDAKKFIIGDTLKSFFQREPGQMTAGSLYPVRPKGLAALEQLIAQGRATQVGSSEDIVASNLPVLILKASVPPPDGVIPEQYGGVVDNQANIAVLPALNADGTLTLTLHPWLRERDANLVSVVVMRDGDTLLFPLDVTDPSQPFIVLVTPRLLRTDEVHQAGAILPGSVPIIH